MKRVLPKTLPFVLIVFAVFTVSLVENLQIVDGFAPSGKKMLFDMQVGETKMVLWNISNIEDETINIEFYATGEGSEFITIETYDSLDPGKAKAYEVYVSIPKDHSDNIEYHTQVFVLKRGEEMPEGQSGALVNVQYQVNADIKIGDNPIYTPPVVVATEKLPPINPKAHEPIVVKEEVIEETIEEKLARIQAANEAKGPVYPGQGEIKIDDEWEESFEEEAVVDYEPEPVDEEPRISGLGELNKQEKECGFIDWLLSLFGMAKC